MAERSRLIVNIDVPDLAAAERFYQAAFGCSIGRRFGDRVTELLGLEAPIYLLANPAGTRPADGAAVRDYARHWTPVHLDVAVQDLDAGSARAIAAGATIDGGIRDMPFGRIATFADPFGHGFCLIQFNAEGYDAIAT